ncbi:MAG: HPP family protein [archaeon]
MAKNKLKKLLATSLFFSICIALTLLVMMVLSIVTDYGITIASFGATIFMILSKKKLSRKKIFGAYMLAACIGSIGSVLPTMTSFSIALTGLVSFFAMSFFDLQHAPAVGFAISMVLNKFPFWTDILVSFCIFIIIGMALIVKFYLKDPDALFEIVHIEREKIKWNF